MLKQFCRSKFLIFANWRDRKKKKSKGTKIFWLLVFGVHIDQPFAHVCIKFQLCFVFCPTIYTWPLSMCIQNLKTLALIEAKKFVTENLLGDKEKWTNKGTDKQQLLHNTTRYTQHLYQVSKSYVQ